MSDIFEAARGAKPKKSRSVFAAAKGEVDMAPVAADPADPAPAAPEPAPIFEPRSIQDIAASTPLREAGMGEVDAVSAHYAKKAQADRDESDRKMALIDLTTAFMQEWMKSGRTPAEFQAKYDITNPADIQNMIDVVSLKQQRLDEEFKQRRGELAVRDIAGEGFRAATGFDIAAEGSSRELMARSRDPRESSTGRDVARTVMGLGGAVAVLSPAQRALAFLGRTGGTAAAFALHGAGTTAVAGGTAEEVAKAAGSGLIQGAVAGQFPGRMGQTGSTAANVGVGGLRAGLSNVAGYAAGQAATGQEVDPLEAAKQFGIGGVLRVTGRGAVDEARTAGEGVRGEKALGMARQSAADAEATQARLVASEAKRAVMERESAARAADYGPAATMLDAEGNPVRVGGPGRGPATDPLIPREPAPEDLFAPVPGRSTGMGRGPGIDPLTPDEGPTPEQRAAYATPYAETGTKGAHGGGRPTQAASDPYGLGPKAEVADPLGARPVRLVDDPEAGFVALPDPLGDGTEVAPKAGPGYVARLSAQAKDVAQHVFGQVFKNVAGRGGGVGDEVVAGGSKALTEAAVYRGEVAKEATAARIASQGGGMMRGDKSRANEDAQRPASEGTHAATSGLRSWIEGGGEPKTKAGQAIKAAWKALLAKTWNLQVERGFTRKGKSGAEEPMRPVPEGDGRVLPYMMNDRGSEIMDVGAGHPSWNPFVDAVAEMNGGMPRARVEEILLERVEKRNSGDVGSEGHMASEFSRSLIIPDFIRGADGGWLPIQEVNPFRAVDALVTRGSYVVGSDMAFGRLSKSKIKDMAKRFKGSPADSENMVAALRSLYGMSPSPSRGGALAGIDTPMGGVKKFYGAMAGLARAATQTGSIGWNAAEFVFGEAGRFAGLHRIIPAVGQTLRDAVQFRLTGRHTPQVQSAIDMGIKTENVPDKSRNIHDSKAIDAINRTSRLLTETFSKPIEEGQETSGGLAARQKVADMMGQVGRFSRFRRERLAGQLEVFADVPREKAIEFLEGTMPQAEMDSMVRHIMERVVPLTTASNLSPAQRSRFEHSPITRTAFKFYRWASNNLRTSAKTVEVAGKSMFGKGRGMAERSAGLASATEFFAFKAIQGAAANLLVAAIFGKEGSFSQEMDRLKKDPWGFFSLAALTNAVAGPIGILATSAARGNVSMRALLPYQIAADFVVPPIKAAVRTAAGDPHGGLLEMGAALERSTPLVRGLSGGAMGKELDKRKSRGMARGR